MSCAVMMSESHKAATGGRAEGSQKRVVIVPVATTGRGFMVERNHRRILGLRLMEPYWGASMVIDNAEATQP
jgi:hypothetical protein